MKLHRFELDDGSGDAAYLILPDYAEEPATIEVGQRSSEDHSSWDTLCFDNTEEPALDVQVIDSPIGFGIFSEIVQEALVQFNLKPPRMPEVGDQITIRIPSDDTLKEDQP